jgi:hypothetical protein
MKVLKEFQKNFKTGKALYCECLCDCGRKFSAVKYKVDSGKISSCSKGACHSKVKNFIGQKFGRLTVVEKNEGRYAGYKCLCDCGSYTTAHSSSLKNGKHASCGCLAKEKMSERVYKGFGVSALNKIYKNYKSAALRRKYDFELTLEQFKEIILKPCHYCGLENSLQDNNRLKHVKEEFLHNGVDRVDNKIGYVSDNCVPCCKICNNSKSTLPLNEWLEWIKRVHSFVSKII